MLSRQLRTVHLRKVASRRSCATALPAVRTYAQTAPAQDAKPPVALYGLDGTYASALVRSRQSCILQELNIFKIQYTAAVKTSALETTSKSLAALADVFKKDPKLPVILTAPTLNSADKSQIIQELQRRMGVSDKGDTVKNFLKTLADNNRLGILQGVCEKFTTLMGAARGEIDLTITSASVSLRPIEVGSQS